MKRAIAVLLLLLVVMVGCTNEFNPEKNDVVSSEKEQNNDEHNGEVEAPAEKDSFEDEKSEAIQTINKNNQQIQSNNAQIRSYQSEYSSLSSRLSSVQSSLATCERNLNNANRQLQNAQQQKVSVYREGIGWTYTTDQNAVRSAQSAVNQYQEQYYSLQSEYN